MESAMDGLKATGKVCLSRYRLFAISLGFVVVERWFSRCVC